MDDLKEKIDEIVNRLDIASDDRQALSADIVQLFNRTNDLDDQGGAIAADVEDLHGRVSQLEEIGRPKVQEPAPIVSKDVFGILRNRVSGAPVATTEETYEDRMKDQRERQEAAVDGFWERATEGLPEGQWRDPSGMVRLKDGRLAAAAEDLWIDETGITRMPDGSRG